MRGRKPMPSALVDILDHPSHGRTDNPNEPQASGDPVKPGFLGDFYEGRASRLWDENAPRTPWIKSADSMALAAWCCLGAEFEDHPGRMSASRIAQWRTLGSLLGLDPSSRSRISGPGEGVSNHARAAKFFERPTSGTQ